MSLIITIAFNAADGKRDELAEKLISIIPDTRAFDGCQQITFTESNDEPGAFMLVETWASAENYEAYKAYRRESGTSVLATDLVAGTADTQYFTILDS